MSAGFMAIALTPSVRDAQAEMGTGHLWGDGDAPRAMDRFGDAEQAFIAQRDSFFLASVSETGWPYVQHRGGPRGFLKVLDDATLAFADYRGNRQYISRGNFAASDKACLFLVDYAHRARLKVYARMEVLPLDADAALAARVVDPGYRARPERIMRLRLEAFDWNCPQHITPRFTEEEFAARITR